MAKQAQKQSSDMEHVWKDISDIWDKLTVKNDNSATPFALTREIAAAGHFTDDMVERIYARYDFCEGYTNKQLDDLKCLALALEANVGKLPEELMSLKQTLTDRITRTKQSNTSSKNASLASGQHELPWKPYSPGAKSTWPEKHQNITFGPQFSYPISARFDNGVWYRHGSNTPLQGVTKYMHVPAPEDWG